jgi:HSP20 family protein
MPTPRYISDPFQQIKQELDEVFDRFLGEGLFPETAQWLLGWDTSPRTDISKDGGVLRIEVDLPGVEPDDVECTLSGNVLTIKGERRKPEREAKASQMQERRFGPFERRITLPEEVEEDSLEARFDRGVLIITARMKSAEGEPRQIKIVGAGN